MVVEGVRGLAKAVARVDPRLTIKELEEVIVAADVEETILEQVEPEQEGEEDEYGLQLDVESPDTVIAVKFS